MRRRWPAAGVHRVPAEQTIVLLTVTTRARRPWLANETAHALLRKVWTEADGWITGEYVLMPDHLHVFCAPKDSRFSIERWIAFWKSQFRKAHENPEWRWQSRGWHHRLRSHESYAEKWRYVWENPVRKGLVTRPEEWPYWGKVFELNWQGK